MDTVDTVDTGDTGGAEGLPIAVIAMGGFPAELGAAEEAGHDPGAQPVQVFDDVRAACAALLANACDLAVSPAHASPAGASPVGASQADTSAAGTSTAHAFPRGLSGTLVLRRLDRALLDGDPVLRVVWPDDLEVEDGYPPVHAPAAVRPRAVIWSGRTPEEAEAARRGLASFFTTLREDLFADATLTLQLGRPVHAIRGALVCDSAAEAAAALSKEFPYGAAVQEATLQLPTTATDLYGVERIFTETTDVCTELFETRGSDPAEAFTTAYALAATLTAWGIDPAGFTGDGPARLAIEVARGERPLAQAIPVASPLDAPSPCEPVAGQRGLMELVVRLWLAGGRVDWAAIEPDHPLQRIPIPKPGDELPPSMEPTRPLSAVPYSFWVLEQLAPASGVSNLAVAFRTTRPLRRLPLQIAVNRLLKRHPALRLRFPSVGGTPVRHLTAPQDAQLKLVTRATTEETLVADLQTFLDEPFDLGRDLLFRAAHFTLPDAAGSVVCLVGHHIVIDAHSMQLLVEELGRFYDSQTAKAPLPAELTGTAPMLEPGAPSQESLDYWQDRLDGADSAAMVLPGSRRSPSSPTFAGHTCSWQLDAETVGALEDLRLRLRTTGNIVLATAFALTLRGHGAGPDLVFGMPVSTRKATGPRLVGYGVSTLPMRVQAELDEDFATVARRVEDAFAEGLEYADASVEAVLTRRGHGTDDWRVPLFRHMFNYRPWTDERVGIQGEVPGYIEDLFDRSRLDLQCVAVQEPGRLTIRAWHSTEVHDEAEIAAFAARMAEVLRQAAAEGAVTDILSPADRALLDRVNATDRTWPGLLPERIAPSEAVAVADQRMTYTELLGRAAAVRELLRDHGVRPGDRVGLGLERSAGLLAAVLGVWQAGAAFVPLDLRQPELRLAYQVSDSAAKLVITADGAPQSWAGSTPVLALPDDEAEPGGGTFPRADDIAYVIYTSGSTGKPKGVQVTHGNLANLVLDFADRLEAPGKVLWSTTPSFDISWLEALLPLATGGTVVVASDEDQLQPRRLLELIVAEDVEVVQATPTAWRLIAPESGGELAGRTVLCGGEPLPAALARELLGLGCRVFNVYGPTETTIWSTAAELTTAPVDWVPAGVPLANTRIFISGPGGREEPPGVPGELCVAGDGVSAGYWNRPELTAERFGHHDRYGRFYRTGDRARLRHDGTLELLGRDDRQVKLRGHRIELGEVEAVLHEHDAVRVAAVVLDGDPQTDGRLVAFLETHGSAGAEHEHGVEDEELWRFARTRLPDYAVPTAYVFTGRLPTTANGKIAYRELAVPQQEGHGEAADTDGVVQRVVELWREALRRPELGPHDNFFLNGGHSVLAVRLIAALEELAGRPVSVRAVFDHPTPAELAEHLGGSR